MPRYKDLPEPELEKMAANERMLFALQAAAKMEQNKTLPFAQVLADLGCSEPAGEPVLMRFLRP